MHKFLLIDEEPLDTATPARDEPRLLIELESRPKVFFTNLLDTLLLREPPPPVVTAQPGEFWPDVFVDGRLPVWGLAESAVYHVLLVTAVIILTHLWMLRPRTVATRSAFDHTTITYYNVSEYLPPLNTGSPPAKQAQKGHPEYAKQQIISVPRDADNSTQTIVAPGNLKLSHDVPLPNLMAWTPVPAPVPAAATTHSASQLTLPIVPGVIEPPAQNTTRKISQLAAALPQPNVIEPPPSTRGLPSQALNAPAPAPVEPPVSTARLNSEHKTEMPGPSVIEPPPSTDAASRKLGDINIAHLNVPVAAPKLPVAEQRAAGGNGDSSPGRANNTGSSGGSGATSAASAPPPSLLQGVGGDRNVGQLIALGIHPSAVTGPITVPSGNRRGVFAAGPEGKVGAPGTPEIKGGGTGLGGSGSGSAGAGNGSGTVPAGISVSGGSTPPGAGVVVAGTPAPTRTDNKQVLMAGVSRPKIAETRTPPSAPDVGKVEERVFGGKKYYSISLNMPNLTSVGGSWIIRFAELHDDKQPGDLTAPVATLKVDPAYPSQLMRDRVEGTVMLYAVIHSDGSVGDVRVLRGVDERLDENARIALMRWRFRPATKNGSAVDLEAVVQIPFQARKLPF
jgi:TonB family protein